MSTPPETAQGPLAADFLWQFRCNGKGCCCGGWRISLTEADVSRLGLAARDTPLAERIGAAMVLKRPGPFAAFILPGANRPLADAGEIGELRRNASGLCTLLADDGLCDVHRHLGERSLPNICQSFPVTTRASEHVTWTSWEFLCPEVAATLANASAPARIVPRPETFPRQLVLDPDPTRDDTRPIIRRRRVPMSAARDFRLAAARFIASHPERPFDTLAACLEALRRWELEGVAPDPATLLDDGSRASGLLDLVAGRLRELPDERDDLKRTLAFARRFFQHHPSGPVPTLDAIAARLDTADTPATARYAAAHLGVLGADDARVCSNWLIAHLTRHLLPRATVFEGFARAVLMLGDALFFRALMQAPGPRTPPPAQLAAAAVALSEAWHRSRDRGTRTFLRALPLTLSRPSMPARVDATQPFMALAERLAAPDPERADAADIFAAWRHSLMPRLAVAARRRALTIRHTLRAEPRLDKLAPSSLDERQAEDAAVARAAEHFARRCAAPPAARANTPPDLRAAMVERLVRDVGLGPDALALVGLLYAVSVDEAFLRVVAHATLDYGTPGLSAPALHTLLPGLGDVDFNTTLARLVRLGLVEVAPDPAFVAGLDIAGQRFLGPAAATLGATAHVAGAAAVQPAPPPLLGDARISLHPDALAMLLGRAPDDDATPPARRLRPEPWHSAIAPPDLLTSSVQAALARIGDFRPGLVIVTGPPGHCRAGLLGDALAHVGPHGFRGAPVVASFDGLVPPGQGPERRRDEVGALRRVQEALAALARVACLRGVHAVAVWPELDREEGPLRQPLAELFAATALALGRPIFIATQSIPRALNAVARTAEVAVPPVTARERARLIARTCPADVVLPDARALTELIRATPAEPRALYGAMHAALAPADAAPAAQRALRIPALGRALRTSLARRIGDFAQLVPVAHHLSDLQLPPDQKKLLVEIITSVRHRRQVMEQWGFATPDRRGQGITSLFHGPPGTGKTMAAGILAAELGLEVFRIDLSRVVDKYVGETEKALARVFDEAERGDVLLLFDEADSLFGKRSEAASAVDRHANLGVNYLLQRIEAYRGLVVLTTNHESHMDPAFKRRIRFQIHFPMPDAGERARIWQHLLPAEAPKAADIDFTWLGEQFELSGGHIRSAVLCAAVMALANEEPIAMRHLLKGGNREYRALGRVVRDLD